MRPGYAKSLVPPGTEGAGNAGRPMRPIAACAMVVVERTRVSQVTPESPGIPRAMVLRLMSYSPRRSGFFVTVAPEKLASQELDASVEASGPHDFAVRKESALVFSASSVHRIPPRARDDRETPLSWDGTTNIWTDSRFLKIRIFFHKGLDRGVDRCPGDLPVGSFSVSVGEAGKVLCRLVLHLHFSRSALLAQPHRSDNVR